MHSSDITLMALFARMDTVAMSVAVGIGIALGLATATAILLLAGAPPGVPIGPNLSALGNILPGYRVTWLGCLIGAAWAGAIGAILGFLIATFWNFAHVIVLAIIAIFYYRRPVAQQKNVTIAQAGISVSPEQQLFSVAVRLNVGISALGVGLGLGLLLFLTTHLSVAVSDRPGRYLNLLGVVMPGYSASSEGAWLGLFWGLLYGALFGGAITALYERSLGARLPEFVMWENASIRQLRPPVLRFSSHALGFAFGCVAALQLLLATWWLVLRGTADWSIHAKLLAHYLPGYTVSMQGSLFGGAELFLLVYVFTILVGEIYNLVTKVRHA